MPETCSTANWDDRKGTTDINDALVIFDKKGGFLAVAQTAIPNYYPRTAQYIPSWDKLPVFTYQNQKYGYQELFVLDDYKYAGRTRIGSIFITRTSQWAASKLYASLMDPERTWTQTNSSDG